MRLKDLLGKPIKNKKSGQTITSIKKIPLKKLGLTEKDLFNMEINKKFILQRRKANEKK